VTAQEHPLTTEVENPQDYRSQSYRIHIGDVLQVSVYKHPELSRKVFVRGDGNYVLPAETEKPQKPSAINETIRDVNVVGQTAVSVANELREKLKPMIANPQVTITVVDTIMRPGPLSPKPSPQLRDTPTPAQRQNSPTS
jgi:protein involved in polysaccharide export with SLBB domain